MDANHLKPISPQRLVRFSCAYPQAHNDHTFAGLRLAMALIRGEMPRILRHRQCSPGFSKKSLFWNRSASEVAAFR